MMKKLLMFIMLLAMAIPLWAGEQTVVINRNEGQFEESNGVYYCYKSGLMMTFTSGMNNPNYLVEHQQVYFEVMSVNTSYIIKKIVFHCVDNTLSNNLDCFYWGPTTISIVQNFYNQSAPGTYTASGYTGTWRGETNHIQFTTMAKPVRFGSVEITYEKETGDVYDLVTSDSQLQTDQKYVIVNQNYSKAMSTAKASSFSQETMSSVGISFVDDTKMKVIINPEVQIFTLRESGETTRPWLLQLTGSTNYLRRNSDMKGSANYNKGYALYYEGLNQTYSPVRIKIGDASDDPYNARIRFKRDPMLNDYTDTCAISYVNSFTYFRTVAYSAWNTYERSQRVYMYMPARNYNITTECDPTAGGFITLGEGVLEINGNQTSQQFQTVHFFVGTNEGYGVNSVTAVDANGNPVELTCTSTSAMGNNYTFTMPAADVHIVATFADPYEIHTSCTPEYGGEFTFNSGAAEMNNKVISNEGKTVNFNVTASLGYVFTGLTCTDDVTGNEITLTDNGDGTYSFTMPGNDVTLSATFDRVIGDIFDLVTSTSQIVEGNTYIIVSQYHDKVMKHWNKSETTFQGTPIVEWVNADKSRVRVDDNACFFRLDDCTYTADPKCSAYMNTLVGYLGYSGSNLVSTPDNSGYNRARMYISNNEHNYLCAFDVIDPTLTNIAIRYEQATNSFKMINYGHSTDERVWLYKLADTYHNISTVCTPPEGGSISASTTSAQSGETVTFTVTTNPGYSFDGVTVTYTDGTTGTIAVTEQDGTYSFTMPDGAVTITAAFTANYNITSTCDPVDAGHVNINNSGAAATSAADALVNVSVTTEWGYRITSVEAVNTVTGEAVELTTVSTSDAGNTYTFTMPAADVRIDAKFHRNLFLLGTAMGRTSWVPAGPEMTYDPVNECYYIDAYFKGVGNEAFGYFSFATGIDSNVDWTDNTVTGGDWSQVTGRLAGSSNPTEIPATATETLQSQYPDNAFKVPAGVYRITVSKDLTTMSIVPIPLHLTFNPVTETTVQPGQEVVISSDLESIVHGIADTYGINEENQQFANSTDDWYTQENDNTAVITQVGDTYVNAAAWIGHISVNDYAVYYIDAPATHDIHYVVNPDPTAGSVSGPDSSQADETVTFNVTTNPGYKIDEVTAMDSDGNPVTVHDNGGGSYSFEMPGKDVTVSVNLLRVYKITVNIDPQGTGEYEFVGVNPDCVESGENVKFYTWGLDDYVVTSIVMTKDQSGQDVIFELNGQHYTDENKWYAYFAMPDDDVTINVNLTKAYRVSYIVEPEGATDRVEILQSLGDENEVFVGNGYAVPGYEVSTDVLAAEGYKLKSITVTVDGTTDVVPFDLVNIYEDDLDDNPFVLQNNYGGYFNMPQADVTVRIVLEPYTPLHLIENKQSTFSEGDTVVVSDDLIVVWAAKDCLWAKDIYPSLYSVELANEEEGHHDYAKIDLPFQKHDWDQSNWVMLDCSDLFTDIEDKAERRRKLDDFVDHKIVGGTIKGVYSYVDIDPDENAIFKGHNMIKLTEPPVVIAHENPGVIEGSLGYPGYLHDPREEYPYDYSYNHYIPTNFYSLADEYENMPITNLTPLITEAYHYFKPGDRAYEWLNDAWWNVDDIWILPPQDQEVAHVWAVYAGVDTIKNDNEEDVLVDKFTMYKYYKNGNVSQNVYDLPGSFSVPAECWKYNRLNTGYGDKSYGRPGSLDNEDSGEDTRLVFGEAYLFHIAIMRLPLQYYSELHLNATTPDEPAAYRDIKYYEVYPLDMDSREGTVTAVPEVMAVMPAATQVESISYFNVMGQESKTPFDGINIVVTRYSDGSISTTKVRK